MNDLARRTMLAGLLAGGALPAWAQGSGSGSGADFPNRPIRLMVPYAPGGTSDIVARLLAVQMQASLGQTVIVENRPGAGSLLATEMVMRAPADGYAIMLADTPLATVATMQAAAGRPAPYDVARDLTAIALLASAPAVMFGSNALPGSGVAEFLALARARPDTVSIASAGVGSTTHLVAEMVIRQSGARIAHVPYRGGAPALQDVAAGVVQATFVTWATGGPVAQSGQVKVLGVAADRRMREQPEVPTLREQGLDIVATFWYGLVGPAGMPAPVRLRLARAAAAAMDRPEVSARLAALSLDRDIRDGAAFQAHIATESERWGAVIRAAGIRAE